MRELNFLLIFSFGLAMVDVQSRKQRSHHRPFLAGPQQHPAPGSPAAAGLRSWGNRRLDLRGLEWGGQKSENHPARR